jgi:hypothetical protein
MSDKLLAVQLQQQFAVHNNVRKVRLSMSRLLTVVNERKNLRDKYRQYLEAQYIDEKKKEEIRDRLESVGHPCPFFANIISTYNLPIVYSKAEICQNTKKWNHKRNTSNY